MPKADVWFKELDKETAERMIEGCAYVISLDHYKNASGKNSTARSRSAGTRGEAATMRNQTPRCTGSHSRPAAGPPDAGARAGWGRAGAAGQQPTQLLSNRLDSARSFDYAALE